MHLPLRGHAADVCPASSKLVYGTIFCSSEQDSASVRQPSHIILYVQQPPADLSSLRSSFLLEPHISWLNVKSTSLLPLRVKDADSSGVEPCSNTVAALATAACPAHPLHSPSLALACEPTSEECTLSSSRGTRPRGRF